MAVILYNELETHEVDVKVFEWVDMELNDTGQPLVRPSMADVCVQLTGVLSTGGACQVQGALNPGTPIWQPLEDAHENILTMLSLKIEQILQSPFQIRPEITAGDGSTVLTLTIKLKRVT